MTRKLREQIKLNKLTRQKLANLWIQGRKDNNNQLSNPTVNKQRMKESSKQSEKHTVINREELVFPKLLHQLISLKIYIHDYLRTVKEKVLRKARAKHRWNFKIETVSDGKDCQQGNFYHNLKEIVSISNFPAFLGAG